MWVAGCARDPTPASQQESLESLLAASYRALEQDYDAAVVRRAVKDLASAAHAQGVRTPRELGTHLFGGEDPLHFVDDRRRDLIRPDLVLRYRQGNCFGLATVFLLIGRELGWRPRMLLQPTPMHCVVGCRDGVFDPTRGFAAVDPLAIADWRAVGKHGWHGAPLTDDRVAALHVAAEATLRLKETGPSETTRAWFGVALSLDGTCAPAHQGLANHALHAGDRATALRHSRFAMSTNPASRVSRELLALSSGSRDASAPASPDD